MSSSDLTTHDILTYTAGVLLSCVISTLNSAGMGLQKRTHRTIATSGGVYWRKRQWQIGLLCLATASIGSLGNYALLGQSRASAMASLTIVTNAIMSVWFLGERFTPIDAAASLTVGVGIIVAVVFGSAAGGAARNSLADIVAVLDRTEVYICTGILVAVMVMCEVVVRYLARRGVAEHSHAEEKTELFLRAFMAGVFSGSTGFFAKAVVACVESMASTGSAADFATWQFWFFLLGLPASIVLQLRSLNGGLRRFDALAVVPIYQGCIVCVVAVCWRWCVGVAWGWTYYQENADLPQVDEAMFAVGVAISVVGIGLLALKKRVPAAEEISHPTVSTALLQVPSKSAAVRPAAFFAIQPMHGVSSIAPNVSMRSVDDVMGRLEMPILSGPPLILPLGEVGSSSEIGGTSRQHRVTSLQADADVPMALARQDGDEGDNLPFLGEKRRAMSR